MTTTTTYDRLLEARENTEVSHPEKLEPTDNIQVKIALRNSGVIDPLKIEEYIARDGYIALHDSITTKTPQDIVQEITDSLLRGRGGAGFPTGVKWKTAADFAADQKFVVCNADEGDPGAYMDRAILETDPHSVLEAMTICGYAIGANKGFIYVRAEYPTAVKNLNVAIQQAKDFGVLGNNIFGTDFSFDIELRLGAGAFVCGEGTALIESIEGKRGMPRTKINRTAHYGLWGKPTIINNVETFANVPTILRNGADWYRGIGTEKSPGTKVFALVGDIQDAGLIEVPLGITLRTIIEELGHGIANGLAFKAVQTGGPSGGCIPAKDLDETVDFENLAKLESIMGSGGMVVMDEHTCMVDIARYFLDFSCDESCGKCVPCREGTKRILEILERITTGKGVPEDLDRLEELSHLTINASLCGLGQAAPNPVLSTLKHFRKEYEEHIFEKKCSAGTCSDLISYFIEDNCIGCGSCARNCPVSCIDGEKKQRHVIRQEECIKCGTCYDVCPTKPKAVVKK